MTTTTNLKSKLVEALMLTRPEIGKTYLYDRCVTKYLAAMLPAISAAISLNYKDVKQQAGEFTFSQQRIREVIGTIGKQQEYIYQVMKADNSTSLLVVIKQGFSKNGVSKLSTVKMNPLYEDIIMDELLNLRVEANQKLLDEIEATWNYPVNVDPASLASFITKTTETIKTTTNGKAYKEKLLRNLMAARQLQSMIHPANQTNETPYLKERWKMDDCGRIYGQGYSLQRMPKEVRHAALGVCHKYDFKASAFAIMAGRAHQIDPSLKLGATLDYIKRRQVIRKQIAADLNITEDLVKTIFTSLGFGAELKNNQHNAIRGALAAAARQQHDPNIRLERDIYNNLGADEFRRLVENRTFGYIYEELQAINTTIIDYYNANELIVGDLTYSDINPKTGKKRNERQKLAWIYQALESEAMQQFAEIAKQEPLLTTHDCIYFKQKLPASVEADLNYLLKLEFPFLCFEHEAIYPIVEQEHFDARFADADRFVLEHLQHLEDEEIDGQRYSELKVQRLPSAKTAHSALFPAPEGASSWAA